MIDEVISFEKMKFGLYRKLADALEISFADLIELEPELHSVVNKKQELVGYKLLFKPDADRGILKKIKILRKDITVDLSILQINESNPKTATKKGET